jgi:8-oxo-dGTP pyrophosphatase MutT (NUDIX family)
VPASLDEIRQKLTHVRPRSLPAEAARHAAVAMVLRQRAGRPEVLFIERAERPGDPWSGHMAFPGGRVGPGDASPRYTAERETAEEVGVALADAELLGQLDDQEGRQGGRAANLVISAYVYHLEKPPPLRPNHEVREAFWFPVPDLVDPGRQVDYTWALVPGAPRYPGIRVGDPRRHVVWGLTYRFLEVFFETLGEPLPNRWPPRE